MKNASRYSLKQYRFGPASIRVAMKKLIKQFRSGLLMLLVAFASLPQRRRMNGRGRAGASRKGLWEFMATLGQPAPGNAPGGRYGAVSWIDNQGNFWLFGGFRDRIWTRGLLWVSQRPLGIQLRHQ